jgi:RNA polymerase sigma-70 factor, ECF subfamily
LGATPREVQTVIDWNMLVRTHSAALYGIAWRILGHAQDAEDVLQEVFQEAHRMPDQKESEAWPALLRRMAACRAIDALRRRRCFVPLESAELVASKDNVETAVAAAELENRLRAAIQELPDREAEVFCLRCFEGYSYREIAAILEISETAVSTALAKARTRLERLLAEKTMRK